MNTALIVTTAVIFGWLIQLTVSSCIQQKRFDDLKNDMENRWPPRKMTAADISPRLWVPLFLVIVTLLIGMR